MGVGLDYGSSKAKDGPGYTGFCELGWCVEREVKYKPPLIFIFYTHNTY